MQEIISNEIIDETDQYEDNHSKRRVRRQTNASVLLGCVINALFFFQSSKRQMIKTHLLLFIFCTLRIVERRRRTRSFSETSSLLDGIRHESESESAESRIVTPYGTV